MAKVFDERRAIFVPASKPHPDCTEYRVAWGYENWGGNLVPVEKTQMVYKGKVAGMLSPSFPDKTIDKKAVRFASDLVEQGYGTGSRKSKLVLVVKEVLDTADFDQIITATKDEIEEYHQQIQQGVVTRPVDVTFDNKLQVEEKLWAFLYRVDIR
ncbi:hypothetical protein [Brevibacillus agri]|uniref:hypothetical protein n=1 Tax=Brevibacillus agri TaxID=51101 RepID=UPI0028682B31|nr:hypothetical protein [Brevibacillus agri]